MVEMAEEQLHSAMVWAVIAVAVPTFFYLLRKTAPYGRHYAGTGWGPHISSRLGWIIMELPAVVVFLAVYLNGKTAFHIVPLLFLVMWQCHYLNRTFIYPFRIRASGRKTPLLVVGSGFFFNVINAYINARFISEFGEYTVGVACRPSFPDRRRGFPSRDCSQPPRRQYPHSSTQAGRDRLCDSAGWRVSLCLVPELYGRNPRMGRLGTGNVVVERPSFLVVHLR